MVWIERFEFRKYKAEVRPPFVTNQTLIQIMCLICHEWWPPLEPGEKDKRYFFLFCNLKSFLFDEMDRMFYLEHAGLHLPGGIKTILFDYCGNLMGLYMKYHNQEVTNLKEPIEIRNPELIQKLWGTHAVLNAELRTKLEKRYNSLLSVPDSVISKADG